MAQMHERMARTSRTPARENKASPVSFNEHQRGSTRSQTQLGDRRSTMQRGSQPVAGNRVEVAVRIRPMNDMEIERAEKVCWRVRHTTVEEMDDEGVTATGKRYVFDNVFGLEDNNFDVYFRSCKEIVKGALHGFNGTILAYGQTGAGKTYTTLGEPTINPGVVPLATHELFSWIESQTDAEVTVTACFIEIYNEQVTDLLKASSRGRREEGSPDALDIVESEMGPRVKGAIEVTLDSQQACLALIAEGDSRRQYASHAMNQRSSRSHSIFRMRVESKPHLRKRMLR